MGYTHYWYRRPDLDRDLFEAAVEDIQRLFRKIPIPIGDWEGGDEPVFAAEGVCFNGRKDAKPGDHYDLMEYHSQEVPISGDGSHETFQVNRQMEKPDWQDDVGGFIFNCCKTRRLPSDVKVMCALVIFNHHFGADFMVSSDGEEREWNVARELCHQFLGYGYGFHLSGPVELDSVVKEVDHADA